jgi:hypothetical protein
VCRFPIVKLGPLDYAKALAAGNSISRDQNR